MKSLVVSIKSSAEVLNDFKHALKRSKRKSDDRHYEISFDNKKDFERFVKNIFILTSIVNFHPKSIYELAKILGKDVSNVNKIILFFEEIGAIKIRERTLSGRVVKTPVVEYEKIEFALKAA